MATPGSLKRIAEFYDERLEDLIPRLLREHKAAFRVAAVLGVAPYTVANWLQNNGWKLDPELNRWVKMPESSPDGDSAA